jgi:hypothetical protein
MAKSGQEQRHFQGTGDVQVWQQDRSTLDIAYPEDEKLPKG